MPPCRTIKWKPKLSIHWTVRSSCVATKYVLNTGADGLFSTGASVLFDQLCVPDIIHLRRAHHTCMNPSKWSLHIKRQHGLDEVSPADNDKTHIPQCNSPQAERKLLVLGLEEIGHGEAATSQEVGLEGKHRRMWSWLEGRCQSTVEHAW